MTKTLTIFRHGHYNQYYQLKNESAYQIYKYAKFISHDLPPVDIIFSSPVLRALQTAKIINVALPNSAFEVRKFLSDENTNLLYQFKLMLNTSVLDQYQHIILVSHEPNIEYLTNLSINKENFITFQAPSWKNILSNYNIIQSSSQLLNFPTDLNQDILNQIDGILNFE